MSETIMIVDAGARGHALAKEYKKADKNRRVIVTPGNDGMVLDNIEIYPETSLKDKYSILKAALKIKPDLVDVAQDDALAAGTVDILEKYGILGFGPKQIDSQLESSKEWSRIKQTKYGLPTPEFETFSIGENTRATDYAFSLINKHETVFFKADGLYAGKGVMAARNELDIKFALNELGKMGSASKRFLIEEGMKGEEFSYYLMLDGKNYKIFKSAQDNKRVSDGDEGLNTGGMGANSPALVTSGIEDIILKTIIDPLMAGFAKDGIEYKGIIYLGGMNLTDGKVKVVEFNSRWGDPEVQVVLPGIQNDYLELVLAATKGKLDKINLSQDFFSRVCIVGASIGYPGDYTKGKEIVIDRERIPEDGDILSAGMKLDGKKLITAGGRIFNGIGKGKDVIEAKNIAQRVMDCVNIEGGYHQRRDIARLDIQRMQQMYK